MAEKTILSVDLYENILTEAPNDYTGKVSITGTFRNADIADRIVAERTEFRKETIVNILELADQKKVEALAAGKSLVDGVGQYLLNISGSFIGTQPAFDPQIHKFGVTYTPGRLLLTALKNLTARVQIAQTGPVINSFTDSTTGQADSVMTVGGPAVITGNNLMMKSVDEAEGLWFTPDDGGEAVKVSLIVQNTRSQIIFSIPQLTPGQYRLSIVSWTGTSYQKLKTSRTYEFPLLLTVESA